MSDEFDPWDEPPKKELRVQDFGPEVRKFFNLESWVEKKAFLDELELKEETPAYNNLYDFLELASECEKTIRLYIHFDASKSDPCIELREYLKSIDSLLRLNGYHENIFDLEEGSGVDGKLPGELTFDLFTLTVDDSLLVKNKEPYYRVLKKLLNYQFAQDQVSEVLSAGFGKTYFNEINNEVSLLQEVLIKTDLKNYSVTLIGESLKLVGHK